jgi:SOS-response transcriptional repressor LexA
MTWWERLKAELKRRGKTARWLARESRVPEKSIYGYLRGDVDNPTGDIMLKLAQAVGWTESQLRYGIASSVTIDLKQIPLITLEQLGKLRIGQDHMAVWDQVSVVAVPMETPTAAFGVTLNDESGEPEFHVGDVVICVPQTSVAPGKYVIAVLDAKSQAVFRKYRPRSADDDQVFGLIAPNDDYPVIDVSPDNPGHVIARAIKHIRDI